MEKGESRSTGELWLSQKKRAVGLSLRITQWIMRNSKQWSRYSMKNCLGYSGRKSRSEALRKSTNSWVFRCAEERFALSVSPRCRDLKGVQRHMPTENIRLQTYLLFLLESCKSLHSLPSALYSLAFQINSALLCFTLYPQSSHPSHAEL